MIVAPVDVDKSIRLKRLQFVFSWENFFNYLYSYILGLVLVFAFVGPLFNPHIHNHPIIVALASIFALWMVLNLILLNTLVSGIGDIVELKNILDKKYGLNIPINEKIIRNIKKSSAFRTGRVITILIDDGTLYMNIITLIRWNAFSPFHGLSNYLKCRRILRAIRK